MPSRRIVCLFSCIGLLAALHGRSAWAEKTGPGYWMDPGVRTMTRGAKVIGTRKLVADLAAGEDFVHLHVDRSTPKPKYRSIRFTVLQGKDHDVTFFDEAGREVEHRQAKDGRKLWRLRSDARFWMHDNVTGKDQLVTVRGSAPEASQPKKRFTKAERQEAASITFARGHSPWGGGTKLDVEFNQALHDATQRIAGARMSVEMLSPVKGVAWRIGDLEKRVSQNPDTYRRQVRFDAKRKTYVADYFWVNGLGEARLSTSVQLRQSGRSTLLTVAGGGDKEVLSLRTTGGRGKGPRKTQVTAVSFHPHDGKQTRMVQREVSQGGVTTGEERYSRLEDGRWSRGFTNKWTVDPFSGAVTKK